MQLTIKDEIEGFGTPYREHANGGETISDPRYFHMREGIVVGADGSATIGPVWWHGRIDFVSGLVLGIIQPATAADS
ncbi:hypothetical protein ASD71_04105 [Achromobacter sp. Root565]|nr:hypothetical protein ASD71_04105 [Achromobacter sp. Root565]